VQIERVEAARAMAYETARYVTGEEGFPPHMPSELKMYGSEMAVNLAELVSAILGLDVTDYHPEEAHWGFWQELVYSLLFTIAGGSGEIQHGTIASGRCGIAR
jgi:alkylation response protein AidB-like acyl-CoA dehydrogenase